MQPKKTEAKFAQCKIHRFKVHDSVACGAFTMPPSLNPAPTRRHGPPSPAPGHRRSAPRRHSPVLERSTPAKPHGAPARPPPPVPCSGGLSTLKRGSAPRSSSRPSDVPSRGVLRTLAGRPGAGLSALLGPARLRLSRKEGWGCQAPPRGAATHGPESRVGRDGGPGSGLGPASGSGVRAPHGARLASDKGQRDERRPSPRDRGKARVRDGRPCVISSRESQ